MSVRGREKTPPHGGPWEKKRRSKKGHLRDKRDRSTNPDPRAAASHHRQPGGGEEGTVTFEKKGPRETTISPCEHERVPKDHKLGGGNIQMIILKTAGLSFCAARDLRGAKRFKDTKNAAVGSSRGPI